MENTERQKRSFPVIFKMSWVILSYSKYKYYLYYTIDDHFSPETKMTGNDHDRKWPEYNPHSDGR